MMLHGDYEVNQEDIERVNKLEAYELELNT